MLIIGTGGLASDILSSLEFDGNIHKNITFYNDTTIEAMNYISENYRILTNEEDAKFFFKSVTKSFIVAVGNNKLRELLSKKFEELGGININYISSKAYVNKHVDIAKKGVIITHFAGVGNGCKIGEGSVIYTHSTLGHDTKIGNYVLISAEVCMANVEVNDYVEVGIGAKFKSGTIVGENSTIGVGAVVRKHVPKNSIASGNPAKIYRKIFNKAVFYD